LKIEPQATVTQNVTMFPVLMRIANENMMLKPGMNAEVEVSIGDRSQSLAVPNSALRTDRDVASAAAVLGLDPEAVQQQIAEARQPERQVAVPTDGETSTNGQTSPRRETFSMMGREVELPEGVTAAQAQAIFTKMRAGGGPDALSAGERRILEQLRGGGRQRTQSDESGVFGGDYIVFTMRDGAVVPVPVRTGLTDLDYSEVLSGLTEADTVLILPSASLLASQEQMRERIQRMTGGGAIPGMGGGPRR
jgi:HlyD family secretion protein